MRKTVFLFSVFVFLLSCNSNSQRRGPGERMTPEERAERTVERMSSELQLTDQQQKELKVWFIASSKEREESFAKNKKNREVMREEMKKQREKQDLQLKKILTEEQYRLYQENEAKRMQEHRGREKGRPGLPDGERPGR